MESQLDLHMSVGEVMNRWPEVIPVFLRHRFGCVGCSMARFDTLLDVAANYHVDPQGLLDELLAMIPAERISR